MRNEPVRRPSISLRVGLRLSHQTTQGPEVPIFLSFLAKSFFCLLSSKQKMND